METEKTPEENSKKRKAEVLSSLQGKCLVLKAHVNEVPLEAIIDTGATISVVSKKTLWLQPTSKRPKQSPLKLGMGKQFLHVGPQQ